MSDKKLTILSITIILIISFIIFLFSPYFNLKYVEIVGANSFNKKIIEKNISSHFNKNLWLLKNNSIKSGIIKNKYIKNLEIEKKYPDTIKIMVQERIPVAQIKNNNKYLIFNNNGYIIKKSSHRKKSIPEVKEIPYSFKNNRIIFSEDISKLIFKLKEIKAENRKLINFIEINDSIEFYLENDIKVNLGKIEKINKKLNILSSLFKKIEEKDNKINYINLSISNKPVVRLKEE